MNKVTADKYRDLTQVAANVGKGIIELNAKCKEIVFTIQSDNHFYSF